MNISLRHLQQIEALAGQGSFAKAARRLNISQPALSRSIALLEDQLKVKLFDRSKREVAPTIFGEHLLQRGKPVLHDMQMMERDLNLLRGLESGELVIGSGPVPAEISIGKTVARFSRNYPKINVRIIVDRTPNLLTRLYNRELDLFVADTRMINDSSKFTVTLLPKQKGYFCCRKGHPLTEKRDLAVKDVFAYPLAVMWFPKPLLNTLIRSAGLQINSLKDLPFGILQCDYLRVLLDIVVESNAVGLTTRSILDGSILQKNFVLLPISLSELNTHYGIVSLSRYSQSPAVRMFEQYMIETEEQCRQDNKQK